MTTGKDFYGKEVASIIEEACREFGVSQEDLDIEVLETGSAGIFGLCKKKAHIRVQVKKSKTASRKKQAIQKPSEAEAAEEKISKVQPVPKKQPKKVQGEGVRQKKEEQGPTQPVEDDQTGALVSPEQQKATQVDEAVEPLAEDVLASIKEDIRHLLELMGYPSQVDLKMEDATLYCHLRGEHEEALTGSDGRTLDSLQYLLRKMMTKRLPDRIMLELDAGDFRQRRTEELKERALQLAEEVKKSGKTQAIPALNPAERRIVHMVLQGDKTIRSRSVGEGLFKKVLIYKPGKGQKTSPRKKKGRQGGRSSEN